MISFRKGTILNQKRLQIRQQLSMEDICLIIFIFNGVSECVGANEIVRKQERVEMKQ